MRKALAELPDDQRTVLALRYGLTDEGEPRTIEQVVRAARHVAQQGAPARGRRARRGWRARARSPRCRSRSRALAPVSGSGTRLLPCSAPERRARTRAAAVPSSSWRTDGLPATSPTMSPPAEMKNVCGRAVAPYRVCDLAARVGDRRIGEVVLADHRAGRAGGLVRRSRRRTARRAAPIASTSPRPGAYRRGRARTGRTRGEARPGSRAAPRDRASPSRRRARTAPGAAAGACPRGSAQRRSPERARAGAGRGSADRLTLRLGARRLSASLPSPPAGRGEPGVIGRSGAFGSFAGVESSPSEVRPEIATTSITMPARTASPPSRYVFRLDMRSCERGRMSLAHPLVDSSNLTRPDHTCCVTISAVGAGVLTGRGLGCGRTLAFPRRCSRVGLRIRGDRSSNADLPVGDQHLRCRPGRLRAAGRRRRLRATCMPSGRAPTGPFFRIQYSTRTPNGDWSAPVNISDPGQTASQPQLDVDPSGNLLVVWTRSDGTNLRIQATFKPFGGSFTAPVTISDPGFDASRAAGRLRQHRARRSPSGSASTARSSACRPAPAPPASGRHVPERGDALRARPGRVQRRRSTPARTSTRTASSSGRARTAPSCGCSPPAAGTWSDSRGRREPAPMRSPLVPAYNPCSGAPNRTHGPPLAFPSCNPPVAVFRALTVGTPDAERLRRRTPCRR